MSRTDEKGDKASYVSRILYLPRGVERFGQLGIEAEYKKDYVLIEAGEVPDFCYIVKDGRIVSYEYTPAGSIKIFHVYEEGTIVGEDNVLFELPSQVSFKAGIDTKVLCITRKALLEAVMGYPEICLDLIQSLATKYQSALNYIRHGNLYSIAWKVCDILLVYARRYGKPYDGRIMIKEKITQQMMSDILGVNRISVTHAIGELKDRGIIEQINGYYCVKDTDKLAAYRDSLLG